MLKYEDFCRLQGITRWSHKYSIRSEAFEECSINGISTDCGCFTTIYPFTTEYIAKYIGKFKLCNESLLTVGSSGDQAINAAYFGCFDIIVYDICPTAKYYFNLKKATIEALTYDEFVEFFSYEHYSILLDETEGKEYTLSFNENIFNKESFKKLKNI